MVINHAVFSSIIIMQKHKKVNIWSYQSYLIVD